MKALKTIIAILAITSITSASFGQSLLDKAKDAAKKNKDAAKEAKKKKSGKGNDKMAVKSSGVSQVNTPAQPAAATTTTGGK